jgi:hypothetical protein
MNTGNFKNGITASLENADRLVEDANSMLEWERFPTSYALAVLAQEEYAKALLMSLVDAGAIPGPQTFDAHFMTTCASSSCQSSWIISLPTLTSS